MAYPQCYNVWLFNKIAYAAKLLQFLCSKILFPLMYLILVQGFSKCLNQTQKHINNRVYYMECFSKSLQFLIRRLMAHSNCVSCHTFEVMLWPY